MSPSFATRLGARSKPCGGIVLFASVLACSSSGEETSVNGGGSSSGGMAMAGAGLSAGGTLGSAGVSGAAGISASSGGSGNQSGGTTTGGFGSPSGGSAMGGVSPRGGVAGYAGGVAGSTGGGSPSTGGDNATGGGGLGGRGGASSESGGGGGIAGGAAGVGGGSSPPFVCNEVVGGKLTYEWFTAGFENGVDNTRWQIKWKDDAFVQEWAKPQSAFWSTPVESACARSTATPDRVVYMVFSWSVKAQADWRMYLTQTVNNFKAKYPSLRRIDVVNQLRGPNNMLCPTPPAANETIVVSPELAAAMTEVAAAFPGLVFLSPAFEARSCSDFQGGGPHLTGAGNMAGAKLIADYFVQTQ